MNVLRKCSQCGIAKRTTRFASSARNARVCLMCLGKNKRSRKEADKLRERAARKVRIDANKRWVSEYKSRPCADCGVQYPPHVMDLDHRLGVRKAAAVSELVSKVTCIERIKAEIAKCDVVCANCHRERTHQRKIFG